MSIKIIGAGFPRTGTSTLKEALEKLGIVKTYHMKELLVHPENLHYWTTLKETNTTDWDALYDGYQATVDFPGYPWYKEHMKRYPDAKVILTVRPFDKWHVSVNSTIKNAGPQTLPQKLMAMAKLAFNPRFRRVIKCVKFAKQTIFQDELQGKFDDKIAAEKIFNQHIADVKAYVPAEKLLVFDAAEGWAPLCEFLNVPVPNEPFPHANKKEDFKAMLGQLAKGNMV
jgi:hypothetical protein